MPTVPAACRAFWNEFLTARGLAPGERFYEAFHFHDNAAGAAELAELVLAGRKRATACLVWFFEHDNRPPPAPGDLSIVTDWQGSPLCVIKTVASNLVPFDEVTSEFAAMEGEGDGSLGYWRDVHTAFFARLCQRIDRQPAAGMPVVCEQFELVFRRTGA